MKEISKEAIRSKTQYGIGIYAHILRLYYPNETVLSLSGRTCTPTKNPFNDDKPTLNIFTYKENVLGNVMDKEFAQHTDSDNVISAGDAFDFAELHYKQTGNDLLQVLNKELNLRIGEKNNFYKQGEGVKPSPNKELDKPQKNKNFAFSFFKSPIRNTTPYKTTSLIQVYDVVKGKYYKQNTEKLRIISDKAEARKFKASNFDYCTFSGVFTSRSDKSLIAHSELICIDFDHVQKLDELRKALLGDEYFDTQLLFVSPSGDGLKWIIEIDTNKASHSQYFKAIANYILKSYLIEIDKSGKDISRACFLPFDPEVFINPKYLQQ